MGPSRRFLPYLLTVPLAVLVASVAGSPALAADIYDAHTWKPLTLNSVNYAPGPNGIELSYYDGRCTAQLYRASGTMSMNVEAQLRDMPSWVNAGTLTDSGLVGIDGPIDYLRFNVTACSSCLGTVTIRCRASE